MESYESYIYKYSPSLTLENTWETTDDILYNVQVTTDTLIIHIWQYKNNIGRGDLIVKYYDLNFNLLKTSNVSDLLNQQGFIVHDLNSFILLNNG